MTQPLPDVTIIPSVPDDPGRREMRRRKMRAGPLSDAAVVEE
jgi:hypothetical protein